MTLKLFNNLTKQEIILENLDDIQDSRLFYHFNLTLPSGCTDGEYTYTLYDEDDVVKATGLLQIGDYRPEVKPYTGNTIQENNGYISYNG